MKQAGVEQIVRVDRSDDLERWEDIGDDVVADRALLYPGKEQGTFERKFV